MSPGDSPDSDDVLLGQLWRRRNSRRRRDWAEVVLRVQCQFTRIGSSRFALHEPTIVDEESCTKSVPRCKTILGLLQSAGRTVFAASPFLFFFAMGTVNHGGTVQQFLTSVIDFVISFAYLLKGASTISTFSGEFTGFERTVRSPSKRTRYSENRLSL